LTGALRNARSARILLDAPASELGRYAGHQMTSAPTLEVLRAKRGYRVVMAAAHIWVCLAITPVISVLTLKFGDALPGIVQNWLFFFSQLAFPSAIGRPYGSRIPLWQPTLAWLLVSSLFGFAAWRLGGWRIWLLAASVMIAVVLVVHTVLHAFGIHTAVDGP
jgi:hypothetical protein